MKQDALSLVRSIHRANKNEDKTNVFRAVSNEFEQLKLEIHLCVDLELIPLKKYVVLSEFVDSIGKQITGWRNANA